MGCFHSKVTKDTIPVHKEQNPITHAPDAPVATDIQHAGNTNSTENRIPINEEAIQTKQSPEEIIKYIELALEKYLPNYNFHHTTSLAEHHVVLNDDKFIMEVTRDNKISLNPDPTGTKLSFGLVTTKYVLYVGVNRSDSLKFVYHWTENGQAYLTSPFFLPTSQEGSTINCAEPVNITDALLQPDPIPGIIHKLKQLNSVNIVSPGSNHNFNGPDFEWKSDGTHTVAFNIQSSTGLYWEDVSGTDGEVKFTKNGAIKLVLKLVSIP